MDVYPIPFSKVPQLNKRDVSYQENIEQYDGLYKYQPEIQEFEKVIKDFSAYSFDRISLVNEIKKQYRDINIGQEVSKNIQLLELEHSFTICTAHQPSLLTGPLYYIYKICSVLKCCQQLTKQYPNYHFIPCFVHGGEDHDFEEVNHFRIFNQTIQWETDQKGSVGRMSTKGIAEVVASLSDILGDGASSQEFIERLNTILGNSKTYSDFVHQLVHLLFAKHGLVQINMDNRSMKSQFSDLIKTELLERNSEQLVQQDQKLIESLGYKAQAFARHINLFYIGHGDRSRIEFQDNRFQVIGADIHWTKEEIIALIDEQPESFSPNVILRPLYQQLILPNLAYIGGGGELAYWLERKSLFEKRNLAFPMLIRRDSFMLVDNKSKTQFENIGFNRNDFFLDTDNLIHRFVQASEDGQFVDLSEEKTRINEQYEALIKKAETLDPTYAKAVYAEQSKQQKVLDQIEVRLKRIVKQKEEQKINRIRKIKNKFFPNNSLQERKDNFLPWYLKKGDQFIDEIIEAADPFDRRFKILID